MTINEKDKLIKRLFHEMSNDMETMSEYGDNEHALLAELLTVDDDILQEYAATFLG